MRFPYAGLPNYQIWARAVASHTDGAIDPQHAARFKVDRATRISSAGSCFAQRIAERLQDAGYNYFVAEPGPLWELPDALAGRGFGTYSARFGDVYTTLQLLQLAQRAVGEFSPQEPAWPMNEGVADPFRPRVEPRGFTSVDSLAADRAQHLDAVRLMLAESDVFVFTMGLTETWCCTADDAALPLCPGAGIGTFDADRYRFRNLTVDENVRYLEEFLRIAWRLNPRLRVILTVSPVPLAATMEPRHVIQSTMWSKSVLRVAAETIRQRYDAVDYFPSYEIVAGQFDGIDGFEADRRTVTGDAVDRVMRSFFHAYAREGESPVATLLGPAAVPKPANDVCDEVYFERFLEENRSS